MRVWASVLWHVLTTPRSHIVSREVYDSGSDFYCTQCPKEWSTR